MSSFKPYNTVKEVKLLSGVSGCGKTTWIFNQYEGGAACVCSADHFFYNSDGEYNFNPMLLPQAHSACFSKYLKSLRFKNTTYETVIVDNTNIQEWEWLNYYYAAQLLNIPVTLHYWQLETLQDVMSCVERNKHSVPKEIICRMALEHTIPPKGQYPKLILHREEFYV